MAGGRSTAIEWTTPGGTRFMGLTQPFLFEFRRPARIALAVVAVGEVGGTLQAVQWHPTTAVLSTRYTRNRRGAGMSEVAIVATVARSVPDTLMPLTLVELRAWAMDSMAVRRTLGAPIERAETRVHRPRPITLDDIDD